MATLLFERALHRDPETGNIVSYWPEFWPLKALYDEYQVVGMYFSPSYMNDPAAMGGNDLKVEWLHTYLPSELQEARRYVGVQRGIRYLGIDPTQGGQSVDPDFLALFVIERVLNKGYALDYYYGRHPVEEQAKVIRNFADKWQPDVSVLEETSARGFVYASLVSGDDPYPYHLLVRTPQGARDKGGKTIRLKAMAARFQVQQLVIPGEVMGDEIVPARHWAYFVNQWRSYPAGHDDILDAAYWSAYEAFQNAPAAAVAANRQEQEISRAQIKRLLEAPRFRNKIIRANGGYMPSVDDVLKQVRTYQELRAWLKKLEAQTPPPADRRGRPIQRIGVQNPDSRMVRRASRSRLR